MVSEKWIQKVREYCEKYNIPLYYLADTLYEPKVVPMIRGKAFEFFVMIALQKILPQSDWEIKKVPMNAQLGSHDVDVKVIHRKTNRIIRVECKLTKKGSYRIFADGHSEIRVKCMRSRTLGTAKVNELAPKLGIDKKSLTIHNDQYLPSDFDVIITTIGNAFYRTDKKTGMFEWSPTEQEQKFLVKLFNESYENLRDSSFAKMFIAKTTDITIAKTSGVICTRKKCKNKYNCGFIPNYPIIYFKPNNLTTSNGWRHLNDSLSVFNSFLK